MTTKPKTPKIGRPKKRPEDLRAYFGTTVARSTLAEIKRRADAQSRSPGQVIDQAIGGGK